MPGADYSRKSDRTILCVARKRAGRLFIDEALKLGCRVLVLTEDAAVHEMQAERPKRPLPQPPP